MRSTPGVLAAIAFLLTIPAAMLGQALGVDAEIIVHFFCGAGFALLATCVFDFKIPLFAKLAGCAASGILSVTFILQGVGNLVTNETLHYLAFKVLGQRLESSLVKIVLLWFVMLLVFDSRGKTRTFGLVVMSIIGCTEIYSWYLSYAERESPALKLFYFAPFVWLLFESKKEKV